MKESFAASFILRPPQIESINSDGSNRRTILTAKDRINRPTAMAIMDRFAILSFFSHFSSHSPSGVSTTWIRNMRRLSELTCLMGTTRKLCSTTK